MLLQSRCCFLKLRRKRLASTVTFQALEFEDRGSSYGSCLLLRMTLEPSVFRYDQDLMNALTLAVPLRYEEKALQVDE